MRSWKKVVNEGRFAILGALLLLACSSVPSILRATPPTPLQSFDATSVAPRSLEETTATAIQRDYSNAWRSLVVALDKNRPTLLEENFVGSARQQWQTAIYSQQQNGLSRRIVDHGHQVQVKFYSLDGSSVQVIDNADFEIEYRNGSRTLYTERIHSRYLVLLTPAESSWKVRALQEIPES